VLKALMLQLRQPGIFSGDAVHTLFMWTVFTLLGYLLHGLLRHAKTVDAFCIFSVAAVVFLYLFVCKRLLGAFLRVGRTSSCATLLC
jgi:hypothetical protein